MVTVTKGVATRKYSNPWNSVKNRPGRETKTPKTVGLKEGDYQFGSGSSVSVKEGPASGNAPITPTQTTDGRPVTPVQGSPGVYMIEGEGLVDLPGTRNTPGYEYQSRQQPGLYRGGKGEQVIVTPGTVPKTSGELYRQIQQAQFQPVMQREPALLRNKVYGVVQGDSINLGNRTITMMDNNNNRKEYKRIPISAIEGQYVDNRDVVKDSAELPSYVPVVPEFQVFQEESSQELLGDRLIRNVVDEETRNLAEFSMFLKRDESTRLDSPGGPGVIFSSIGKGGAVWLYSSLSQPYYATKKLLAEGVAKGELFFQDVKDIKPDWALKTLPENFPRSTERTQLILSDIRPKGAVLVAALAAPTIENVVGRTLDVVTGVGLTKAANVQTPKVNVVGDFRLSSPSDVTLVPGGISAVGEGTVKTRVSIGKEVYVADSPASYNLGIQGELRPVVGGEVGMLVNVPGRSVKLPFSEPRVFSLFGKEVTWPGLKPLVLRGEKNIFINEQLTGGFETIYASAPKTKVLTIGGERVVVSLKDTSGLAKVEPVGSRLVLTNQANDKLFIAESRIVKSKPLDYVVPKVNVEGKTVGAVRSVGEGTGIYDAFVELVGERNKNFGSTELGGVQSYKTNFQVFERNNKGFFVATRKGTGIGLQDVTEFNKPFVNLRSVKNDPGVLYDYAPYVGSEGRVVSQQLSVASGAPAGGVLVGVSERGFKLLKKSGLDDEPLAPIAPIVDKSFDDLLIVGKKGQASSGASSVIPESPRSIVRPSGPGIENPIIDVSGYRLSGLKGSSKIGGGIVLPTTGVKGVIGSPRYDEGIISIEGLSIGGDIGVGNRERSLLSSKPSTLFGQEQEGTQRSGYSSKSVTESAVKEMLKADIAEEPKSVYGTETIVEQRIVPFFRIIPGEKVPPPIIPILPGDEEFPRRKRGVLSRGRLSPEFIGQVKRRGKWLSVGRGSRGVALSRGLSVARSSLAASVRVVPTGRFVDSPDVGVSLRGFRDYRVERGRKVPLRDEFVQVRAARLSSPGERREIKGSRGGWL